MEHRLNPQALTATTLLIAESAPAGKDLMIRLIVNLLVGPSKWLAASGRPESLPLRLLSAPEAIHHAAIPTPSRIRQPGLQRCGPE